MILVKPSFEIRTDLDGMKMLRNIEEAGRVCYKSEDKITDESAEKFVRGIIKSGHHSVIEHESLSVKFICDRGVTHEMVRHRLAAYSQESTRYCNYGKDKFKNQVTYIIPVWSNIPEGVYNDTYICKTGGEQIWFNAMLNLEQDYLNLLNVGWVPQQARSILPNSLKTEIVMTCNVREWRHVFNLRTSMAAHPQIVEVMKPLQQKLQEMVPVIFDQEKKVNK
jgi:thymidylate synthase (FAD)